MGAASKWLDLSLEDGSLASSRLSSGLAFFFPFTFFGSDCKGCAGDEIFDFLSGEGAGAWSEAALSLQGVSLILELLNWTKNQPNCTTLKSNYAQLSLC
jgi:hypothetical protein